MERNFQMIEAICKNHHDIGGEDQKEEYSEDTSWSSQRKEFRESMYQVWENLDEFELISITILIIVLRIKEEINVCVEFAKFT